MRLRKYCRVFLVCAVMVGCLGVTARATDSAVWLEELRI